MSELRVGGGDSPLNVQLGSVDLHITGNYGNDLQLNLNHTGGQDIHTSRPKLEVLTELLGNLLKLKESDIAKSVLISDNGSDIISITNETIRKIEIELTRY